MTNHIELSEEAPDVAEVPGLFTRLKAHFKRTLSDIGEHCRTVEQAKEASDRQALKDNGKDWVNRCCG